MLPSITQEKLLEIPGKPQKGMTRETLGEITDKLLDEILEKFRKNLRILRIPNSAKNLWMNPRKNFRGTWGSTGTTEQSMPNYQINQYQEITIHRSYTHSIKTPQKSRRKLQKITRMNSSGNPESYSFYQRNIGRNPESRGRTSKGIPAEISRGTPEETTGIPFGDNRECSSCWNHWRNPGGNPAKIYRKGQGAALGISSISTEIQSKITVKISNWIPTGVSNTFFSEIFPDSSQKSIVIFQYSFQDFYQKLSRVSKS